MVTAIGIALGHSDKLSHLEPYFLGGHLGIGTLHHITTIENRGGSVCYPHHKQILFTLPNIEHTTMSNKKNENYDRVIIREMVLPREDQVVKR